MMETLRKAMMMRSKLKNINNSQESYVNWYTDKKERNSRLKLLHKTK